MKYWRIDAELSREKGGFVSLFEGLSFTNFLTVVESFQNLRMHIEEKSIPTCWAWPHARDHVQIFYFILQESY